MTDADTQAAIDALAHRLRERDEAMRNGGEYADADPFAAQQTITACQYCRFTDSGPGEAES